jgi:hypothetical protein
MPTAGQGPIRSGRYEPTSSADSVVMCALAMASDIPESIIRLRERYPQGVGKPRGGNGSLPHFRVVNYAWCLGLVNIRSGA